eukprot:gene40178-49688_t
MRRLGYNPKNLAAAGGVLASSRDLTDSELETYTAELGVNVGDGSSCKLMLSTISLGFTSLMNAKSTAKKDAQSGSEEKKGDQQPVKKKKFNGIFGSKSHGWAIQTEEDSEEEMDREEREMSTPLFIRGIWKEANRFHATTGFRTLDIDSTGEDALGKVRDTERQVPLHLTDFLFLLKHGQATRFGSK